MAIRTLQQGLLSTSCSHQMAETANAYSTPAVLRSCPRAGLRPGAKSEHILEPAQPSVSLQGQPARQAVVLHRQQAACHALLIVLALIMLMPWLSL